MRFTLCAVSAAVTPDLIRGPVKQCPPAAGFRYWMLGQARHDESDRRFGTAI
jgi:hypothetical protein